MHTVKKNMRRQSPTNKKFLKSNSISGARHHWTQSSNIRGVFRTQPNIYDGGLKTFSRC